MRNTAISGTQLPSESELLLAATQGLLKTLRMRLPSSWELQLTKEARFGRRRWDAILAVTPPNCRSARILIEVKRRLEPRDVPLLIEQFRQYAQPDDQLLVATTFLSQQTRSRLAQYDIDYVDMTGNLRFALKQPIVYLETCGATKSPWPNQRATSLQSLKGAATGRVIRALCDFRPPYGVRELAERSQTPLASVSRVVDLLERDALLTRTKNNGVQNVLWASTIERWVEDYHVTTSNKVATLLAPRGLDALTTRLKQSSLRYAITGSLAATQFAPIAPPRLAMIYVEDAILARQELELRPAERGINVLLLEPFDPVAFERASARNGIWYAAVSQVAADLLTSPGRAPEEGRELVRWMGENEDAWRT